MAIHIPPPSKWSHKHIILVTLIGTLVATAMVAVISISLSPAHIYFSIKEPIEDTATNADADEDTQFYNFTLVARNTSPRMAVLYGALNAEIWYSQTAWVPAMVNTSVLEDGRRQAPAWVSDIKVSAQYWQSEQASSSSSSNNTGSPPPATNTNTDWSNCTVVVIAKVWFKAGSGISTRSYNIRNFCKGVKFVKIDEPSRTVDCTADY